MSFTISGATGLTLQRHQILYLPLEMTIQNLDRNLKRHVQCPDHDPSMIRKWSKHEPVSPQPAAQPRLVSRWARAFCMEKHNNLRSGYVSKLHQVLRLPRKMTIKNLTEICNVIYNAPTMIRAWSENDPSMSPSVRNLPREHFVWKNVTFCSATMIPNFTNYCACHKKWQFDFTKYCACNESGTWTSRNTALATKKLHEILRLPRKLTLELHQMLRLPRKLTSNSNSPNGAPARKSDPTCIWLYYDYDLWVALLLLDSTFAWLYYCLTLLLLDPTFPWFSYYLTLLDSTITRFYYYLTLLLLDLILLDSTLPWLYYYLTLLLLDSTSARLYDSASSWQYFTLALPPRDSTVTWLCDVVRIGMFLNLNFPWQIFSYLNVKMFEYPKNQYMQIKYVCTYFFVFQFFQNA